MLASKENASQALMSLQSLEDRSRERSVDISGEEVDFIREFIEAAVKRLPTEAAIAKNRQRK